jgi:glycosyltransferase involved in cell wall biosynthesis
VRVLIDYRPALRERSGVGEYAHGLAVALLQARAARHATGAAWDVLLFSSSWKHRLARPPELADASIVDRRVPVRLLNFAWHRLQWPPVDWLVDGAFDVAHSLHPLLMPARRAARIVTIHDLNFLLHPERTRAEIRRDYPTLARAHARQADRVIVVSAFTAGQAVQLLDVPPERISVCPPSAPLWAPRAGSTPDGGYILFFGTLEPRKNLGTLLDAYERLVSRRRDLPTLLLAGKATDQSGPWLERIARAPLAGRVRHVGYVDPAARRALYEGAAVLVQPSFEEGFGLPVLEAMTVGVPVVAANRGALPEVLGDAGALVDAEDADAFAGAIERVIDDPPAAAAAAGRGLARARSFTAARTAETTLAAYEAAVAHRAGARGAP